MPSRSNTFRAACALTVLGGAGWIAALHPDETPATAAPDPLRIPRTVSGGVSAAAVKRSVGLPLAQIGELLVRQRELAPADRGGEDEIRRALAGLLTDDNVASIVQALSEDDRQSEFGVEALARWAATDVLAASLWLAHQPTQSNEQTSAISPLLVKDMVVLEVLCERLPAGAWRETLLENASRAAQRDNCAGAALLAQSMQSGVDRTRVLLGIADEWAQRDPVAAAHWIAAQSESVLRDELVLAAASAQASTDPVGALEWTRVIASDVTFERAIGKVAAMWADYAPQRAGRFAALHERPDPKLKK